MAKGAARVDIDVAGGVIIGILAPTVFVNGTNISVIGDPVAGHGLPPHDAPVMVTGSSTVFANGIPVCRLGDVASCGDAVSPCSGNVFIG